MTTLYYPGDRPALALAAFQRNGRTPMVVLASPAEYRYHWYNTVYPPGVTVKIGDLLCIAPERCDQFDAVETYIDDSDVMARLERFKRNTLKGEVTP
jgi:hypothetical protein